MYSFIHSQTRAVATFFKYTHDCIFDVSLPRRPNLPNKTCYVRLLSKTIDIEHPP